MSESFNSDDAKRLRDVENKVAIVTTTQKHNADYLDKIDQTLSKLTEVSSNLSKILAVQEQRLTEVEKTSESIRSNLETLQGEVGGKPSNEELKTLHKDVSSMKRNMYISWGVFVAFIFIIKNIDFFVRILGAS